ncbi:MAG: type transport system permease protein [Actinomycetota bacterium]|jgi:ABC-2 type transport system permease protein|nr:type transport system permease protein [Actinomycetota bacterium]
MIETVALARLKPVRQASFTAFGALVLRDLVVLRKGLGVFIIRTIMQPLLFVFVFTYVFPKIGQGIGGAAGAAQFSSLLVPGVVAIACIFQGIQAVALPLVQEFSYTREIEDRVMAPLPVWAVATEKIVAGALQGVIAGVIVFPLALVIPTTAVHLSVRWFELVTFLPLAAIVGASLGLAIGTRVKPQQVPLLFSIIVLPLTFLGATYYPWARLTPILWLKWVVLINPLVYMSEAFRTALTPQIPHMPTGLIYVALIGFAAGLTWLGIDGFNRRVLA